MSERPQRPQVRVDGVAEIPAHKWYEFIDVFTRMDELLVIISKQIDLTNRILRAIAVALGAPISPMPTAPEAIALAPPAVVSPISPALPAGARIRLVRTDQYSVSSDVYKEIPLIYDMAIIHPDSDVLIAESQESKGLRLVSSTYLVLSRYPELSKIYVKAVSGTATVYLAFFEVSS